MQDLLPYYERELAFLRRYSRQFAERYPKIAGRLMLAGDVSEDPHVERLIESFALMGARISRKLEDDYPEFTEALLQVLYPHYLRPFPSCSIAHFDMRDAATQLSAPVNVPRGTELLTRPVRGVPCRFRTAYDTRLTPLHIAAAEFRSEPAAPLSVSLPTAATARITLHFALQSQQASLAQLGIEQARIFVDGEPSLCAALRDTLAMHVVRSYVEPADSKGHWTRLDDNPLAPVGLADDEALIDMPARSHPAYRLLTEYFAFPEKFGFFDIDLRKAGQAGGRRFAVHLIVSDLAPDSVPVRLMLSLGAANFKLGCTPIVNLFGQNAEPIRANPTQTEYPVVADARRAWAYEIHSIDRVACVRNTPQGESVVEYRPFYSLRHGENPDQSEQYWTARRNAAVAEQSPGYELELSMVNPDFDVVTPSSDVLVLDITCSNRDLPTQLRYGATDGDLSMEGGSVARAITMLRKPTPSRRFDNGRGAQWRLISHLSLNHVSLVDGGVDNLREVLRLYDMAGSSASARQIAGLISLTQDANNAWLPGRPFASVVRGTEIRLAVDESHFVGAGIHAFALVLDRFFGLYVHANSFTRLIVESSHNQEELIRCPPRNGELILV